MQWENSIYYTQFFDAIVTDKFTYNGSDSVLYNGTMSQVMASQNKQKAYLYGFSSQFKAFVTDHLSLSVGISYTYARIKTDSTDYPLDHIPPFMANLQLHYKYKKFNTDFVVMYNAAKAMKDYYIGGEDNEVYATADGTPAWFTANWNLSYNVWKYITLQAGIENIFDTQYRTFASGINAPGRNIYGVIKFNL
jgi:hemoglobin/transferrin/lactoferrin receptor protein